MFENLFTSVVSLVLFVSFILSSGLVTADGSSFEASSSNASKSYAQAKVFTQSASVGMIP